MEQSPPPYEQIHPAYRFPNRTINPSRETSSNSLRSLWRRACNWRRAPKAETSTQSLIHPQGSIRCWKPLTLGTPVLLFIIIVSALLIAVIQVLLSNSQKNDGIIFASDINDLPLSRAFNYLYLPTVIAVIYSFLWSWIDHDAKRLEPYHQMSKPGGASGKDSLALQYPHDFIASVPIFAVKRGHWPVFCASLSMVLIFWGITPTQSGIFATETVSKAQNISMLRSTSLMNATEQHNKLTGEYAQSVYNIAWFNESLPKFMSKDYALAPFTSVIPMDTIETNETWTAETELYSLDMNCEVAGKEGKGNWPQYTSKSGCSYAGPVPSFDIQWHSGSNKDVVPKNYSAYFVGYYSTNYTDWYLAGYCPETANHTFLAGWWTKPGNISAIDYWSGTIIYCEPTYYRQNVTATVALPNMTVVGMDRLGPKVPLSDDEFDSANFEKATNDGIMDAATNRGTYMNSAWPKSTSHVEKMDVDSVWLPVISAYALATYQRPAADYMDSETLALSYQAAYRLLFGRLMIEALGTDVSANSSIPVQGSRQYQTQAIKIVPVFAHIVQGFLGAIILATAGLIYLSLTKPRLLSSDPASIASLMSLVADNDNLLSKLKPFDKAPADVLHKSLDQDSFMLKSNEAPPPGYLVESAKEGAGFSEISAEHLQDASNLDFDPVRPTEFRLLSGLLLLTFQITVFVLVLVLYIRIQTLNGLPLPSSSQFVRQLLENYIPTVIATVIEPVWVTLNRLLCVLQPFEELRKGKSTAQRTITLDYSSLPPQLVFLRALKAGHALLAVVCLMAIIANVLAIAYSGLFFEDSVQSPRPATFSVPYSPTMNSSDLTHLEGTGNYTDLPNIDLFAHVMSNLTAGTSYPAWTDENRFYMPFRGDASANSSTLHRTTTQTFSSELECYIPTVNYTVGRDGWSVVLKNISKADEGNLCEDSITLFTPSSGDMGGIQALEIMPQPVCDGYMVAGWWRSNSTLTKPPHLYGGIVTFHSLRTSFLACHPKVRTGFADVTVDNTGVVQKAVLLNETAISATQLAQPLAEFINNVHGLMKGALTPSGYAWPNTWHRDPYPSDMWNYLMGQMMNSTEFLNPASELPKAEAMEPYLKSLYTRLFAVMIGNNMDTLFQETTEAKTITGSTSQPETRIFMSVPMFIISEVIMGCYILVTVLVYIRRPWRFLPRMPTTIASILAYAAASTAILDLKGTAGLSARERERMIQKLDHRYGFGSFVGTDGKAHMGIERTPFVAPLLRKAESSDSDSDRASGEESGGAIQRIRSWGRKRWGKGKEGGFI